MGYVDSRRKQESASGGMRLANGHGIVDPQTGSIVAWCVYAIKGGKCQALSYEQIKWRISMTNFVENDGAPPDSQVVGQTWQYVNKNGGPDRRFSYNPQYPICRYGELDVTFSRMGSTTLQLSGTRMAEGIARLTNRT